MNVHNGALHGRTLSKEHHLHGEFCMSLIGSTKKTIVFMALQDFGLAVSSQRHDRQTLVVWFSPMRLAQGFLARARALEQLGWPPADHACSTQKEIELKEF